MTLDGAARKVGRLIASSARQPLTLVCIEGPAGAGKSTLAGAVADVIPGGAAVVHSDEFYGPEQGDWRSWSPRQGYLRFFDHARLERELLRPLSHGADTQFQRYDWVDRAPGDKVDVVARGVLIVEGCYLLRSSLRPYWGASVYVETPAEVRRARLTTRGEFDVGWITAWTAAEDYYLDVERPAEAADLVVPGGDLTRDSEPAGLKASRESDGLRS